MHVGSVLFLDGNIRDMVTPEDLGKSIDANT